MSNCPRALGLVDRHQAPSEQRGSGPCSSSGNDGVVGGAGGGGQTWPARGPRGYCWTCRSGVEVWGGAFRGDRAMLTG